MGRVVVAVCGAVAGLFVAKKLSDGADAPSGDAPRFVPARHFKRGAPGRPVDWIVLHTTENPCAVGVADAVARYFATQPDSVTTSAHFVVGPDEAIQCVSLDDIAWHAPPANDHGVGVELTGRAAFTPAQWSSPEASAMLERAADVVAGVAGAKNVPIAFVDAAGLLRGERGITTHAEVARAWRKTDHTDPGASFPREHFLELVRAREGVA